MNQLSDFISSERERFAEENNNKFAMSFSQICRYSAFIAIILNRYEKASQEFLANTQAMRAAVPPGKTPASPSVLELHERGVQLTYELHLEIESFYLFAKILLDKVARSVEFYFGPARRKPLDSHDDLVKNFESYARDRGLTLPPDFMALAREAKKNISDYRDYEIAHEKSPRRITGTAFDEKGNVRMASVNLYPTEKDEQVESKVVHQLSTEIDTYTNKIIELLRLNKEKTNLIKR